MDNNEYPQAFPVHRESNNGMSLRDYFAAAALSHELVGKMPISSDIYLRCVALQCYEIADAMINAREETVTVSKTRSEAANGKTQNG